MFVEGTMFYYQVVEGPSGYGPDQIRAYVPSKNVEESRVGVGCIGGDRKGGGLL